MDVIRVNILSYFLVLIDTYVLYCLVETDAGILGMLLDIVETDTDPYVRYRILLSYVICGLLLHKV